MGKNEREYRYMKQKEERERSKENVTIKKNTCFWHVEKINRFGIYSQWGAPTSGNAFRNKLKTLVLSLIIDMQRDD
jgi:hypothetical protein